MAAVTDHEAFPQPANPDALVWRYTDLPKLVSLLSTSELYLTQLAEMEDPWEGKYPPSIRQATDEYWTKFVDPTGKMKYPLDRIVELIRRSVYVNCWCIQAHESEALWRIFGRDTGVAVRTTYRRLTDGLPPSVFIGKVRYVDPATASFPTANVLNLAMHKRHFFQHEVECRIVRFAPSEIASKAPENQPKGLSVPIDIPKTLQDVVVSPLAPDWYYECVRAVVGRFMPLMPVLKSAMH